MTAGGVSFGHPIAYSIDTGVSGDFEVDFTTNFSNNNVYYHSGDFTVTLNYTVGGLPCTRTVTGRYGPVVTPVVPQTTITGPFDIYATAFDPDPDGIIQRVYFEIRDSAGTIVLYRGMNFSSRIVSMVIPAGYAIRSLQGGIGPEQATGLITVCTPCMCRRAMMILEPPEPTSSTHASCVLLISRCL